MENFIIGALFQKSMKYIKENLLPELIKFNKINVYAINTAVFNDFMKNKIIYFI